MLSTIKMGDVDMPILEILLHWLQYIELTKMEMFSSPIFIVDNTVVFRSGAPSGSLYVVTMHQRLVLTPIMMIVF